MVNELVWLFCSMCMHIIIYYPIHVYGHPIWVHTWSCAMYSYEWSISHALPVKCFKYVHKFEIWQVVKGVHSVKNQTTGEVQYLNRLIHSCSEDSCRDLLLTIQKFTARYRGSNTVHSRSHSRLCSIRFQKTSYSMGIQEFWHSRFWYHSQSNPRVCEGSTLSSYSYIY